MSNKKAPQGSIRTEHKTAGESPVEHVLKAGGYSLAGLGATVKHEMAFRIELALFVFLVPIVVVFPVGLVFKALILGSMMMVLCAELLNSALEWIVDYISLDHHPYAKRAKDMGSAAVMVALINCGLMWALAILEWILNGGPL